MGLNCGWWLKLKIQRKVDGERRRRVTGNVLIFRMKMNYTFSNYLKLFVTIGKLHIFSEPRIYK